MSNMSKYNSFYKELVHHIHRHLYFFLHNVGIDGL